MNIRIADIMTEFVVSIREDVSVQNAAHLMLRQKINGVFIISRENPNDILGVFTTTDLLRILGGVLGDKTKMQETLSVIGAEPAICHASRTVERIPHDAPLIDAIELMCEKNIHTLPVFEGDSLVGVVGRHDILNAAFCIGGAEA